MSEDVVIKFSELRALIIFSLLSGLFSIWLNSDNVNINNAIPKGIAEITIKKNYKGLYQGMDLPSMRHDMRRWLHRTDVPYPEGMPGYIGPGCFSDRYSRYPDMHGSRLRNPAPGIHDKLKQVSWTERREGSAWIESSFCA